MARGTTTKTGESIATLPGAAPFSPALKERLSEAVRDGKLPGKPRTRHLNEDGTPRFVNRLISEVSPYLLQHAHNPVNWYPWGDEAFQAAKEEGKLIFLSIGYSTCHWCHVMEEESFEDLEVATLLNENYVSIKVDREERPDIDDIFMTVCRVMTGSGGWPLTVILTPDRKPIFSGTYVPKTARMGMPGMMDILPGVVDAWRKDPEKIRQVSGRIEAALRETEESRAGEAMSAAYIETAYAQLKEQYDPVNGGFGSAPKFPTPHNLTFLLRYWKRSGDGAALSMVEKTLEAMRSGGIYDQLGFGFHRYSTDAGWIVPHFEKMLYDQAQLATLYAEAFLATGRTEFALTAREILTYVLRDMTSPEGGFYSAEDADSDGEEGKFYYWTTKEVRDILGDEESRLFLRAYNVEEEGNFPGGSHGMNILYLRGSLDQLASDLGIEPASMAAGLEAARERLFAAREARIHPSKDDKILTAWNGMMITALAKGYQAFDVERYRSAAVQAADFILSEMTDADGRLVRRYRDGTASLPAHLNDYAFMIQGLIDLYEATFEVEYLKQAIRLDGIVLDRFLDKDDGGYFFTADDGEQLLVRRKEVYDGAIPSGNSITELNLIRLWRMTGKPEYGERAARLMSAFSGQIAPNPAAYAQFMNAVDFGLGPSYEVVIAGAAGAEDTGTMLRALRGEFLPNKVVLFRPPGDAGLEITEIADYTGSQTAIDGRATAYVCRDFSCRVPTVDVDTMLSSLGVGR